MAGGALLPKEAHAMSGTCDGTPAAVSFLGEPSVRIQLNHGIQLPRRPPAMFLAPPHAPMTRRARALAALCMATVLGGCGSASVARSTSTLPAAEPTSWTNGLAGPAGSEVASESPSVEIFDEAWRVVRDTHFDRTLSGLDWDAVRTEFRPQAEAARTPQELREVIEAMLARLGQSHFQVIPLAGDGTLAGRDSVGTASGADHSAAASSESQARAAHDRPEGTVGLDVRLIDDLVVVRTVEPASSADVCGVRPGWSIAQVDQIDPQSALADVPVGLEGAWRTFVETRTVASLLDGPEGDSKVIRFRDPTDQSVELQLELLPMAGEVVRFGGLPPLHARLTSRWIAAAELAAVPVRSPAREPRIGLIAFNIWMVPVAAPFHQAIDTFRQADGLIIDLRGNPGGIGALAMGLAGHFCETPLSLGTMRTRGGDLEFRANPRRTNVAGERVEPFSGPVAILIDEMTGSTSEVFAGGLQSHGRVRIFGTRSAGAALPAQMSTLPNGDTLLHAIADFTTPDGTRLEGRGVIPDEVVPLPRAELLAGRDAPLLAAVRWIDGLALATRGEGIP